ncbi:Signal peptide peptidase-like protein [Elsinoe fawcettii]|nr:Signal peptide peptidase-like protein [Elsinoe fawcettii]
MSLHLIGSALLPIYTGSHASLSRPSSTSKPKRKKAGDERGKGDTTDSEAEDEDLVTKMEGMSPSDAILFPLLAGCTLAGLYMLIKYMGPALLNKILAVYFGGMAFFSVARMINDIFAVIQSFVFPKFYRSQGQIWKIDQRKRESLSLGRVSGGATVNQIRHGNPLPGSLGGMQYGSVATDNLWKLRALLDKQYLVAFHLRQVVDIKAKVSLRSIVASAIAVAILLYANFISTPWYLTNLQGFAFSYTALQLLSPTTFGTGSLILVALFFYDIYFVFYTPLMVSVATNLDVPIKLLFPRPEEEGKKAGLAMLGLGDVVLPGIMIGLALRFDLYIYYLRKQHATRNAAGKEEVVKPKYVPVTGRWGDYFWTGPSSNLTSTSTSGVQPEKSTGAMNSRVSINDILPRFPRTYFHASIVGYILGMSVTLIIMHVFKHAQPALLYLVPGVLGSIWSTALFRGEVKDLWEYTEMVEDEDEEKEKTKQESVVKNKSGEEQKSGNWFSDFFSTSFFGTAKQERNAKRLEESIKRSIQSDEVASDKTPSKSGSAEEKNPKSFIGFSIKPAPAKRVRSGDVAKSDESIGGSSSSKEAEEPRRRSARLTRSSSGSEGSEDAVLINKADAASFIDEGTSTRKRKAKA